MKTKKLKEFLIASNRAGYAGGDEKKWINEPDGPTTIAFEQGEWRSHDNFFGGEPYGGRSIVFYKEKPIWMMVYYGWVGEDANADQVYEVLRNALMQMPEDYPLRGPKRYKVGEFLYRNKWKGKVDGFFGQERITQGKKLIYQANYMGGEIDKRAGI